MKNRDVYQKKPDQITLLNNDVAAMTDALTTDERRTLRFELEHLVCEGQYRSGLISLFAAGYLRAAANGVALHPPQLDQAKVPSVDFRIESATIETRQRLELRGLFQKAGVDCKPNEEAAAAGRLLSQLRQLANGARSAT